MDRRHFLQMLGIGGAALLSTAAAASPVPLFSGKDSKIWTPEHTSLTRSHLVLTRPSRASWQQAANPLGADPNILRVNREPWPRVGDRTLHPVDDGGFWWNHAWVAPPENGAFAKNIPDVKVEVPEGADAHEAFYRAASWMRDRFTEQSRERLLAVSEAVRPTCHLVTLVDTPIFAGPTARRDDDRGFLLQISYTPYLVRTGELEPNGWEVHSENGEYPLEIPTDIDMDRLLHVDRQIVMGGMEPRRLGGRLILGT